LVALRRHHARRAAAFDTLASLYHSRRFHFTKQAPLGLLTFVSTRLCAHALLNASEARFVHTF
jgi:hypothetical protein